MKNYEIPEGLGKDQKMRKEIKEFQEKNDFIPLTQKLFFQHKGEEVFYQAGKENKKEGNVVVRFLKDNKKEASEEKWSGWINTGEKMTGLDMGTAARIAEKEIPRILEMKQEESTPRKKSLTEEMEAVGE
ncbi:MAG: hypothetical protein K9M15_00520 [Candidatus Marinimicrobia bacterium]|nr:hypothetical protein [Candidatus Neomarinimicrobiota bacterium]